MNATRNAECLPLAAAMSTMRQGAQDANAFLDIGAMIETRNRVRHGGASLYAGVEDEANFSIVAHEPTFIQASRDDDDDDNQLYVLSALNGQGAIASELFRDKGADFIELVRQSVKNSIRLGGLAIAGCRVNEASIGCAISVDGLNTVKIGNGHYGPHISSETRISPGQACVWEVPVSGGEGLLPPEGGDYTEEIYRSKFVLQLRPRDPRCVGDTLLFHARQLLTNTHAWLNIMNDTLYGTRKWLSAVRSFSRSYLVALTLGTGELIRAGIVIPTPSAVSVLVGSENATLTTLISGDDVAIAALTAANRREAADTFAAALGELLKATDIETPMQTRILAMKNGNATAQRSRRNLLALPSRYLNVVFADGRNKEFEFGFDAEGPEGLPVYRGRFENDLTVVNMSTPSGALLGAQLTHAPRMCAAIMDAAQEDDRWTAGVALTGGNGVGSHYIKLATGIRR